ncbi:DUF1983 domain-containing protein [Pseudoalteromonas sp. SCSIO 43088]|uniref:phage tail tip fiber protein n=1 Tax=Pseudoalteromonas sp. SCSIO 43088 TaxID=2822846 RepID=UPI00202AEE6E|nr:hypothetical protein [Pseudoalteromonas sp. SCSIO 43088]URQ87741.1 DUF1983 domain-containing protein [Pseudoalteromonas sp. SCSIO 43088]
MAKKLKRSDFPGIGRQNDKQTQSALAENIELLTGQRGSGENRALLVKDLVNLDQMKMAALRQSAKNGNTNDGGLPITAGGVERPHKPVNLTGTGGFTFIALTWDHPTYRGHAYAEIWRSETDSFSSATLIATEVADVFSDSVSMGAEYFYWVRFVNVADMKGPTQGAAGLKVVTQESAEMILDEIGGLIEKSHLGGFLTSAIDSIPAIEQSISDIYLEEIPALKVDIDQFEIDIADLRTNVDQFLIDIPNIQDAISDIQVEIPSINDSINALSQEAESAKQTAEEAKGRVESIEISNDDLARQLIDAALINDENWQNNAIKFVLFESELDNMNARIEAEFLTKTEANEAIAAAAETIRVEIEEHGTSLSADISNTYYTKATADQAIATSRNELKAEIEDPNGTSVGALLDTQYYTAADTDSAISLSAQQIKANIEDPQGNSLGALINSDYYTGTETDTAIAAYGVQLKSLIEDPEGDGLGATLQTNYYTKTDTDSALSQVTTNLESAIELAGQETESAILATLDTQYYTITETDSAISQATTQLKSQIDGEISATLTSDYFTKTETNQAITIASQLLKSEIEDPEGNSLGATLFTDYFTKADTEAAISRSIFELNSRFDPLAQAVIDNALANDEAHSKQQVITANILQQQQVTTDETKALAESLTVIESQFNDSSARITELTKSFSDSLAASAQSTFQLLSTINENKAFLETNYLTKVDTEEAISQAETRLQSSINGTSSDIYQNFYTKSQAESAISTAVTALGSSIDSDIGEVSADLQNNYYTSIETDSAISQATQLLKSEIEDPDGNSIGAILLSDYSTKTEIDNAISEASLQLSSSIDDLEANIFDSVYTIAGANEAIANSVTALRSELNQTIEEGDNETLKAVTADLQNNYYTNVAVDSAIAQATTTLKSDIEDPNGESLGAELFTKYYTKTDTDGALAELNTQIRAEMDPLSHAAIENALANDESNSQRLLFEAEIISKQQALVDEQGAIAESIFALRSEFGDSQAELYRLEETFAGTVLATAKEVTRLESSIDDVSATLLNSYDTSVTTAEAITSATTALRSLIEDPDGDSLGATLFNNFQTKADAVEASASTSQQLRAEFEPSAQAIIENALANDLEGERRIFAEADLILNQRVLANEQTALSESVFALNTAIDESNAGLYQLQTAFATKAQATAQDLLKLDSDVGDVKADLINNYLTSASVNEAIASADLALRAAMEDPDGDSIGADLQTNYYTKAAADSAISSATTQLKSTIEDQAGSSIGADLYNNYYTKTAANNAISTATTTLKSQIEDTNGSSVGASLQTLSQTVATNEGVFSSLWGVKTNVNGLQSSIGLVNDGVEPIFAVKGAKFAVITDQDPTNLTPVFAVSDGKTVINTAVIDQAFIQSLVTDELLSNRVVVGSQLSSPSINYNPSTGARSNNFSIDPNGNMLAKSATLESVTIKDSSGNVVMSSTGAIPSSKVTGLGTFASKSSLNYSELGGKPTLGTLAAKNSLSFNELTGYLDYDEITGKPVLGPFAGLSKILSSNVSTYIANGAIGSAQIDQAYINTLFGNNASFYGTVYAANIEGDVTDLRVKTSSNVNATTHSQEYTVISFTIASLPFARSVTVSGIKIIGSHGYSVPPRAEVLLYVSGFSGAQDSYTHAFSGSDGTRTAVTKTLAATIPANSSRTVTLKIKKTSTEGTQTVNAPAQSIICQTFKDGSTIS